MQALIVFDFGTAKRIRIAVAGVGHLLRIQPRIFRDRDAWELWGTSAQCDLLEVAGIAMDAEYYRIDIE